MLRKLLNGNRSSHNLQKFKISKFSARTLNHEDQVIAQQTANLKLITENI